MADHNLPTTASLYADFVSQLDARFDDLAVGLDPARTTATNVPVWTIRWNSVTNRDEIWNGTGWVVKSALYAINISGNAGSATNTTNVGVTDDTATAATMYPLFSAAASGNNPTKASSTKLTFNPSTGVLAATSFTGAGTGLTGTAAALSIGGTATNATNVAVTNDVSTAATMYPLFAVASSGNNGTKASSTKLTFNPSTGVLSATTFAGAGTDLTGTAASLSIGGTAATATNATNVAVTNDVTTAATMYPLFAAASTGNNGTKASSTKLTFNPSTGVLSATTFAGAGTNLTGTASGLSIGGNAATATDATNSTNAANVGTTDDTATAATMYPTFVSAVSGNNPAKVSSTKLTFNPSTGVLSSTSFAGAGTGLTGTASGLSIGGTAALSTAVAGGTAGALLYQSNVGVTASLADVAVGNVVLSGGAGAAPAYGKVGLTTHVSGILPLANGGTTGSTQATALAGLGAILNGVLAKTATYAVVAGDRGKVLDCSGTWSLTLTAAATLGDGFAFSVVNSGAGVITIDPAASELIDGGVSKAITPGQSCLVVCSSTAFRTVGLSGSGGAVGGGTDSAFYENDQTVTADYTITAGKNAVSAGPITISTGITVTVPTGSEWTVV